MNQDAVRGEIFLYRGSPIAYRVEKDEHGICQVKADLTLHHDQAGTVGHEQVHAGTLSALLGEAMQIAARCAASPPVTCARISVECYRPVPLGRTIHVTAHVRERVCSWFYTAGSIRLGDGHMAAEGSGLYIHQHDLEDAIMPD